MDDQKQAALWGSPRDALDMLRGAGIAGYDAIDYLLKRLDLEMVRAKAGVAIVQAGEFIDRCIDQPVPSGLWSIEPRLTVQSPFWDTGDVTIERRGFNEARDRFRGPVQLLSVHFDLLGLERCLPVNVAADNALSEGGTGGRDGGDAPTGEMPPFDRKTKWETLEQWYKRHCAAAPPEGLSRVVDERMCAAAGIPRELWRALRHDAPAHWHKDGKKKPVAARN